MGPWTSFMQQSGQQSDAYPGGNRGNDQNLLNPYNILATDFASGGAPCIGSYQPIWIPRAPER